MNWKKISDIRVLLALEYGIRALIRVAILLNTHKLNKVVLNRVFTLWQLLIFFIVDIVSWQYQQYCKPFEVLVILLIIQVIYWGTEDWYFDVIPLYQGQDRIRVKDFHNIMLIVKCICIWMALKQQLYWSFIIIIFSY